VSAADYYVDGVCLSETGLQQIKILSLEHSQQPIRRKRPGLSKRFQDDLQSIDSVVPGNKKFSLFTYITI
jgi:hypothetical protein